MQAPLAFDSKFLLGQSPEVHSSPSLPLYSCLTGGLSLPSQDAFHRNPCVLWLLFSAECVSKPTLVIYTRPASVCHSLAWVNRSRMCWSPVVPLPATRLITLPLLTPPQLGISPPEVTSRGTFAVASVGLMPSTDWGVKVPRRASRSRSGFARLNGWGDDGGWMAGVGISCVLGPLAGRLIHGSTGKG